MNKILISILLTIPLGLFSQNNVTGVITDIDGVEMPSVHILEIGTQNATITNQTGEFVIATFQDSCSLRISFIGYEAKNIAVNQDTTVVLNLTVDEKFELINFYNTRWLAFGTSYEFFNSVLGFQISNGFDDEHLIHFEDFQDDFLFRIGGQTDFNSNYSLGADIGWSNPFRYLNRVAISYSKLNYMESKLSMQDINIQANIGYFRNLLLLSKVGYQFLNEQGNFGLGIGAELGVSGAYLGVISGYYSKYFHHSAYLHIGIPGTELLSLRATYNRIDTYNLLAIGVHYAFVRNNNR